MANAIEKLSTKGGVEARGAFNTKPEVVDFILDLAGYTPDAPLTEYRILEPSFGAGDFLIELVDRLLKHALNKGAASCQDLAPAVRAVELHRPTFEATRKLVFNKLCGHGLPSADADRICDAWLYQGDFLLADLDGEFTHIVGNPPYVRQESIPDILMAEYRMRYKTIYDRADIYVPFIERSLGLLSAAGRLSFICADRWMKNKYGQKLRELVSRNYALTTYVDMFGADAFHAEVSAYPAITVIERAKNQVTRVLGQSAVEAGSLRPLATELTAERLPKNSKAREIRNVANGAEPWILGSFDELALARRLEARLPTIEEAGCKVGIGVATGADRAFIGDFASLDVEASRKLPLVMTRDILAGQVAWRGKGVVNPFGDDGRLVDLQQYPRLRAYLEERRGQIASRHVARKNPHGWYRTIDRIYPELIYREKLLIPDIKDDVSIAYEGGQLYPHHNLYYITSNEWNLHALSAVMRSGIARLFVSLYCTRMRGGFLRFQAQYLRKIRIPRWNSISVDLRNALTDDARTRNRHQLNEIVSELYGLNASELELIQGRVKK